MKRRIKRKPIYNNMTMKGKYNNNGINYYLDIWKMIFSYIIALMHSTMMFSLGYLGVEFFLIISGYMMLERLENNGYSTSPGEAAIKLVTGKIKSLFPYILFSVVELQFIAFIRHTENIWYSNIYMRLHNIISELLLIGFYFPGELWDTPLWYLSVFIVAYPVVYYIVSKYQDLTNILCIIVPLIIYSFFYNTYGSISVRDNNIFIIKGGVLRAVAGLFSGVLCYKCMAGFKRFFDKHFILMSIFELCIVGGVMLGLNLPKEYRCTILDFDILILIFVLCLFICSRSTLLFYLFSPLKTSIFRKVSIAIFITHFPFLTGIFPLIRNCYGKNVMCVIYLLMISVIAFIAIIFKNLYSVSINFLGEH